VFYCGEREKRKKQEKNSRVKRIQGRSVENKNMATEAKGE